MKPILSSISHAVIPVVDSIKNLSNLDFLVSVPFHPPMSYPPKSIMFIDHKLSTAAVARYLNARLPEAARRVFKFRHLHSSMSMEHNEMVFDEFRKPDGLVQGIVTTSGASTVTVPMRSMTVIRNPQSILRTARIFPSSSRLEGLIIQAKG